MVNAKDVLPKRGKGSKVKRNWSAIKNLANNMQGFTPTARAMRKLFFEKTGMSIFKESNYKKMVSQGRIFTVSDVRKAHAMIVKKHNDVIRKEYNAELKDRIVLELSKAYHRLPSKQKKNMTFKKWEKTKAGKEKKKEIERLEKRNLSFKKYKRANKATLDKLEKFESVEELYNSPD